MVSLRVCCMQGVFPPTTFESLGLPSGWYSEYLCVWNVFCIWSSCIAWYAVHRTSL